MIAFISGTTRFLIGIVASVRGDGELDGVVGVDVDVMPALLDVGVGAR